jgi:two-component system, LytTR family, response regulator
MTTSAIIIDDEKNALEVLHHQLNKYCPHVNVLAKCSSGEEGIEIIKLLNPDLVFLDIEMPHISGFEVLESTKGKNYKVIFTTAYNQFAIKAFRYAAIDYLLKPIDIEELKQAVSKSSQTSLTSLSDTIEKLLTHLSPQQFRLDKIALPFAGGLEMVPFANVVRAESESNYTTCYLLDGRKTTVSKTLGEIEHLFPIAIFFRIHNSHLVNLNHIKKLFRSDGGYVTMVDGYQINISRSKKDEFWDKIAKI